MQLAKVTFDWLELKRVQWSSWLLVKVSPVILGSSVLLEGIAISPMGDNVPCSRTEVIASVF